MKSAGGSLNILETVLERARVLGSAGVVVFDLDSTLLDNRPRQARILREFGAAHGLGPLCSARPEHWEGWEIGRAMANAGLGAEEVERFCGPARIFWRERFFTSEYCTLDVAIVGAADYVNAVRASGAQVAYVTGRHELMRLGSVQSFRDHGFPLPGPGVHLIMKPRLELSDDDWKESTYAELRALGQVLAAFDNEPTHANGYRQGFPEAIVVRLDTDHSGRPVKLAEGIVEVKNFAGRSRP